MARSPGDAEYEEEEEYAEEYADDPPAAVAPPARPPMRATRPPPGGRPTPPPAARPARPPAAEPTAPYSEPPRLARRRAPAYMPAPPPPRSGNWQNIALGFIGAAILGLLVLLAVLVIQRANPPAAPPVAQGAPPAPAVGGNVGTNPTAPPAGGDPPRLPLADFKKLYDDPATRPLIYDVRTTDIYAAGHIPGAGSLPEADLDTRFKEVPKDRLVVLYCQ